MLIIKFAGKKLTVGFKQQKHPNKKKQFVKEYEKQHVHMRHEHYIQRRFGHIKMTCDSLRFLVWQDEYVGNNVSYNQFC